MKANNNKNKRKTKNRVMSTTSQPQINVKKGKTAISKISVNAQPFIPRGFSLGGHQEVGSDIITTTTLRVSDFNIVTILPINPLFWPDTRARDVAKLYQNYKVNSLSVTYTSNFSYNASGTLYAGLFALPNQPTDINMIMNTASCGQTHVRDSHTFRFNVNASNLQRMYKIHGELEESDCCPWFIVFATNRVTQDGQTYTGKIGSLVAKYNFSFTNPCRQQPQMMSAKLVEDINDFVNTHSFKGHILTLSSFGSLTPLDDPIEVYPGSVIRAVDATTFYMKDIELKQLANLPAIVYGRDIDHLETNFEKLYYESQSMLATFISYTTTLLGQYNSERNRVNVLLARGVGSVSDIVANKGFVQATDWTSPTGPTCVINVNPTSPKEYYWSLIENGTLIPKSAYYKKWENLTAVNQFPGIWCGITTQKLDGQNYVKASQGVIMEQIPTPPPIPGDLEKYCKSKAITGINKLCKLMVKDAPETVVEEEIICKDDH